MYTMFYNQGIEVLKDDSNKYYMRFYTGGHADYLKTVEITAEEAEQLRNKTNRNDLIHYLHNQLADKYYGD